MGHPFFQGKQQYTEVTTINIYLLIKIRHNDFIQCHGDYIEVKKLGILRKYFQKNIWGPEE